MHSVCLICLREGFFSNPIPVPTWTLHGLTFMTLSVWIYQMHLKSCPRICALYHQKMVTRSMKFHCKQYGKHANQCIRWICALI